HAEPLRVHPASLIDRERGRHRDGTLVRERVGVRPESHVQAEPSQPQPAAPAELDPLALIARDAAAQRPQADPLLPADVHGGPAPQAAPMSRATPWPSVFPGLECCVTVRPSGVTGFAPAKIGFPVMKLASPSVRKYPTPR